MTEPESFMHAVANNLFEKTPWLVFADWLQDHGHEAVPEIIRRSAESAEPGTYVAKSSNPHPQHPDREIRPYHVPDDHPIGEPSVHLTQPWINAGKVMVGVNALFRMPWRRQSKMFGNVVGHGVAVEPHEAHRLLSDMASNGVRNADTALGHLSQWFEPEQLHPSEPQVERKSRGSKSKPKTAIDSSTRIRLARAGLRHRLARVEHAEVHPDYQPSGIAPRLGHALQEIAAGRNLMDDPAAHLAEGILRTGDHQLLPILADALDETEHPLATAFDYRHAPRAMEIDRALQQELGRRSSFGWDEHHGRHGLRPLPASEVRWRWYNRERGGGQRLSRTAALTAVRKAVSDANPADVVHSLLRLADNENINRSERSWQRLSKVDVGVEPPGWFRGGAHTTASALLFPKQQVDWTNNRIEPHKYPDTRSQKKRKLSRLGLRLKYALERTQPLRKPQPELDLADTNPDIRTPQQIAEQNPPLQKPDFKRLDATDPSVKGFATVLKERAARHEENGTHQLHEELVARMQPPRGSPYSTTVAQSHLTGDQFVVVGLHDPKGNLVRHGVFGWEEIKKLAKTEPWLRTRLKGLALTGKAGVSKYEAETDTLLKYQSTPHKFSSTFIRLEGETADKLLSMANAVDENDLGDDGRELEPHVTVRYGLETDEAGEVAQTVSGWGPVGYTLGSVSLFAGKDSGKDYDVVKVDVDSDDLRRLNKKLADLPHTDTHPEYRPHSTVAYVKAGLGEKYLKKFTDPLNVTGTADSIVFSNRDREQTTIPLTGSPSKYAAYKAPAGGMVVRGIWYKGGTIIPGSEFWSQSAKFKRLKKRVKRRKGKQIKSNASAGQPLVVDFTSPA